MNTRQKNPFLGLEELLGYCFSNRLLLEEALTHRSYINEVADRSLKDNQRLEFFGDTVIDFILSEMLLKRFPLLREGELSKIRSSLVDEESLANLAAGIKLGAFLKLGKGEEGSGGRNKRSVLADAYEALLAAVYLDGGIDPARHVVERHFRELLDKSSIEPARNDYKSILQEMTQASCNQTPHYRVTEVTGPDHDRIFKSAVYLGDDLLGEGIGRSKREAEQLAAKNGMDRFKGRVK
jgi:ribonuclease-3